MGLKFASKSMQNKLPLTFTFVQIGSFQDCELEKRPSGLLAETIGRALASSEANDDGMQRHNGMGWQGGIDYGLDSTVAWQHKHMERRKEFGRSGVGVDGHW